MVFGASGETANAFLEDGNIDSLNEFVPVVDIIDQNSRTRAAFLLSSIRCAQIEITSVLGRLAEGQH